MNIDDRDKAGDLDSDPEMDDDGFSNFSKQSSDNEVDESIDKLISKEE